MNRIHFFSAAAMIAMTGTALAQPAATPPKPATPSTIPAERAAGGHEKINFLDFYDVNGDASVTRSEFDGQRASDYKRIDASGNNAVDDPEYVGEFTVRLDRQLAAIREGQIKQAHSRFKVLDKNKDGQITPDEFANAGNNLLAAFDSNKDGVVDEKDKAENF